MNGQKMTRKRFEISKEFKNKSFVLTLLNLKALVLAVLLFPFIGIGNINAQELYVSSFSTTEVLRYNGETGAFIDVFVSAMSGGLDGPAFLVFRELQPRNIPTLSEWGLIAMAGILGITGFMVIRRRKITA
jgi:IPTL-CTERM motif